MTEKRFERIYADVDVFCRDHNAKGISQLIEKEDYDKIVDLLNELHEKNKELRLQLNLCSDQRNEFHRGVIENANRVGKLQKENEQLKQSNNEAIELILDGIVEMHDGKRDYAETIFNKAIRLLKGDVE